MPYQRLVERGKACLAYPSALAWYAVRQVREGRRVGNRLNIRDVLSSYAQQRKGFAVESLPHPGTGGRWEELLAENKRSTPADLAACRLDFHAWLRRLNRRKRKVALRLAGGETTQEASRHFGVSQARISQLRRELQQSWSEFQGEALAAA